MVKRNAEHYLSLQAVPAPNFSDGDPHRYPDQTIPQKTGPVNYYIPCYPEDKKTLMWLSKLGTAVYKNGIHTLPSNTSTHTIRNRSSPARSASASPFACSSNGLVLAPQTPATRTSLPVAPSIAIGAREEVTSRLVSFPAGYKLFVHACEVGPGNRYHTTIEKGDDKGRRKNIRHDTYLFGHPSGAKFRSPNEFLPHLWWMINDPLHTKCQCLNCGITVPSRQLAIDPNKPERNSQKQTVGRGPIFGAAAVAALVKGAPIFRIGELVWAKSKTTFVKLPEGAPTGAFLPDVQLWPAVIHKIHRDGVLPTKYEAFLLKLHRENSAPRSISVLEERLLPWLAHSPNEPTSADLLAAGDLGVVELAMYREALFHVHHQIQHKYRPFGGHHKPPMSARELRLYSDPSTREWMKKQHTFEQYAGIWFGTERILCQEVVRMHAESGPEVPSRDPKNDESQFDFFYVRSIFNDPDDGLTVAGDIYRRRRAEHSENTLDGFDGEYVWYQASQKVEEFTVGICSIAGRYYHQYPKLHSRMEVKEMALEADRSIALQLNRSISCSGLEKEGGTYIWEVLHPKCPTSTDNLGTNRIETRSKIRDLGLNSGRRRNLSQSEVEPTNGYSLRKRMKTGKPSHVRSYSNGAKANRLPTSALSGDEATHGRSDTISEASFGNEIIETIISPTTESEFDQKNRGIGQEKPFPKANASSDSNSHHDERSHMKTGSYKSDTEKCQSLHEERRDGIPLELKRKRHVAAPKPVAGHQLRSSDVEGAHGSQTTSRRSSSKEFFVEPYPTSSSVSTSTSNDTTMGQTSNTDQEAHYLSHSADTPSFDNVKSEEELEPTSTPIHNNTSHDLHYPPSILPSSKSDVSSKSKAAPSSSVSSKTSNTLGSRSDQKGPKSSTKRAAPKDHPPRPDSSRTPAVLKWRGKLRIDNFDACDAIGLPLEKSASGMLVVPDRQGSRLHASLLARIPEMLQISMRIPVENAERYFSKLDQVLSSKNCMCLVLTASRLSKDGGKARVVFDEMVQGMKSGGYCGAIKQGGLRMLIKPQDDMLLCLAQFGTDTSAPEQTLGADTPADDAASEWTRLNDAIVEPVPSAPKHPADATPENVLTEPRERIGASPKPINTPIRSLSPSTEDSSVRSVRFRTSPVIACVNFADQVRGTVDLSDCTSLSMLVHAIGSALGYGDSWLEKTPSDVRLRFTGFDHVIWTILEENRDVTPARENGDEKVTRSLDDVREFAMRLNTTYTAGTLADEKETKI